MKDDPVRAHTGEFLANLDLLPAVVSIDSTRVTHGSVFALSSENGDIEQHTQQGFYAYDTRFLSRFSVMLNGDRLRSTGFATFEDRLASFYCSAGGGLNVVRDRYVADAFHEDISVANHSRKSVKITLELTFDVDFADIFEVRLGRIHKPGRIGIEPREGQHLALVYRRENFVRETWIRFSKQPAIRDKTAIFEFTLEPKQRWSTCVDVVPVIDHVTNRAPCVSQILSSPFGPYQRDRAFLGFFRQREASLPLETVPELKTDNPDLHQAYYRAIADLRALRLEQQKGYYTLAAGLPWFMAVFGRDSILSAIQTKLLGPQFMVGTLHTLAGLQAKDVDCFREAEPGKIIHEVRRGELSVFEHVPHSRYYGSIDATPLFIGLLWEAYQWTGDRSLLERFLTHAEAALSWVDDYGDLDGDGFIEYKRRTRTGLRNQGWKDSGDSISFADGRLAAGPIALAEVQGYVYDAKKKMADIYRMLNNPLSEKLEREAAEIKERFNDLFWMPDERYFAIALDGRKRQVDSISSNPGHCLWSGIVDADKAAKVAERLMAPDMFGGWGIRTLSTEMGRFNPLSYHNGSVWPHDNSIIAAGLMRYGFVDEANQIAMALIHATSIFAAHRLPELFAGFARREYSFPVPYPAANAPQAWASGALIYLMESMLGVSAGKERLFVDVNVQKNPPFRLSGVCYRGNSQTLP